MGNKHVTLSAAGHNEKVPLLLIGNTSSIIAGSTHVKTWTTINAAGEETVHELCTEQREVHELYRRSMYSLSVVLCELVFSFMLSAIHSSSVVLLARWHSPAATTTPHAFVVS